MIRSIFIIISLIIFTSCGGVQNVNTSANIQIDKTKTYLVVDRGAWIGGLNI
jgi:hypothetical protein